MKSQTIEIIDSKGNTSIFYVTASDQITIFLDGEDVQLSEVHSTGRQF